MKIQGLNRFVRFAVHWTRNHMFSLLGLAVLIFMVAFAFSALFTEGEALADKGSKEPVAKEIEKTPARNQFASRVANLPFLGLSTGERDVNGMPVRIPCSTCHMETVKVSKEKLKSHEGAFHKHIKIEHGAKTCNTCHKPPEFSGFARADGSTIEYEDVMQLCGQCHARRLTEYQNGAHGGMNGYWDLSKGPRERNHCLNCHNPHSPSIKQVKPAKKLKNRSFD